MKQLLSCGDERVLNFCAFCGRETGTRDHCPSRVFLDEPYPENLPVVAACANCNGAFSIDEEYFACLVSCVIAGSTNPEDMPREKIRRILNHKPALRMRIEQSRSIADGTTVFSFEHERVTAIVTKLAQGHALYELHELCARAPDNIAFLPLSLMTDEERIAFETSEPLSVWPEIGSRSMQRLILKTNGFSADWLDVQPGRYRYLALPNRGVEIRIVIHEYLACCVFWEH